MSLHPFLSSFRNLARFWCSVASVECKQRLVLSMTLSAVVGVRVTNDLTGQVTYMEAPAQSAKTSLYGDCLMAE